MSSKQSTPDDRDAKWIEHCRLALDEFFRLRLHRQPIGALKPADANEEPLVMTGSEDRARGDVK